MQKGTGSVVILYLFGSIQLIVHGRGLGDFRRGRNGDHHGWHHSSKHRECRCRLLHVVVTPNDAQEVEVGPGWGKVCRWVEMMTVIGGQHP